MMSYAPSLKVKAAAELELRRRKRPAPALLDYSQNTAGFIHDCVRIDNAQPEDDSVLEAIPFHLWPAQQALLSLIGNERLILILKARQLGISWLVCAYAVWLCLYRPSRLVLFFSIGQGEANEMMRRATAIYWRLSAELRASLPKPIKDNTEELRFDNGSAIQSLPSRKSAGSSYTASLIVLDELAKNENAESLYTAVKPTIDGGGSMIILSTAHGAGNLFYRLVDKARQGLGKFLFHFIPWHARPGRDAAWYSAIAADAIDDAHMKQEYPASPDEAFEATEVDAFLKHPEHWKACRDSLPPLTSREPLVVAADAGETDDTFAIVATGRHPTDPTRIAHRMVKVFYPEGKAGISFVAVQAWLIDFCRAHNVIEVCYDRYQLRLMMEQLTREGIATEEFKQSGERLEADKMYRDLIQSRGLAHDGNEELSEHVANANIKIGADGQIRIVKRTHALKIDAAVAGSMSAHRFLTGYNL
jgi:hypothetical protein